MKLTDKRILLLFFIALGYQCLHAQTKPDTLQIAKQLRDKGKYKNANALLKAYHAHYPADINALWLYAQTEFWAGHFQQSKKLYKKAVVLQPDKDMLRLDFAGSLLNMGDWKTADSEIRTLERKNKTYSDQLYSRARISYYKGDYNQAKKEVKTAMDSNTQSIKAKQLYDDIMTARAPWIRLGASYSWDNQPIKTVTPFVEAGLFLHRYSSLQFSFYSPVIIRGNDISNAELISVGNTSAFKQWGLMMKADIGFAKFPYENKIGWTGDIYLRKTFIQHLVFDALAERKPYLYTYSSIDTNLNVGHFTGSLAWDDERYVNGKAGLDFNYFADKNYVYTVYGIIYAPTIKFSIIRLQLGYSYSFSDSRRNDYTSTRPLDTIVKYFATAPNITGIYNPYFTPEHQHIHSALIYLRINPTKKIEIGATGSVGFYAYTQNPYLYLNKNANQELYVARDFSTEKFIPAEAGAYAQWQIGKKYTLKADYKYRSTYFYASQAVSLSFKMSIWKS